ncbi:MAG: hypothetical protein V1899_11280 [Planctomycetota bacterium]
MKNKVRQSWALAIISACACLALQLQATEIIQTVAGGGSLDGYIALEANLRMQTSQSVAVNALGEIYFSDSGHNQVLSVNPTTGRVSIVAGNGTACYFGDNLPAPSAGLKNPGGLAFDGTGNLFIVDRGNYVVRRVDALSGIITTVAGRGGQYTNQIAAGNPPLGNAGPATACTFSQTMADIIIDGAGNVLVADTGNSQVRRFTVGGNIDAVPATGINYPIGIAVNSSSVLFIADSNLRQVFKIDGAGVATVVAGDGTGGSSGFSGDGGAAVSAQIGSLGGLAFDSKGNLLITCMGASRIRKVDVASATPIIVTIAGNGGSTIGDGGPATGAFLSTPTDIALDSSDNSFIYDLGNGRIRRVDATTGFIDTVAGTGLTGFIGDRGPKQTCVLAGPRGMAFDAAGNLYIADTDDNAIRKVAPNGIVSTLVGSGTTNGLGDGGPSYLASLSGPRDVVVSGNTLFIADRNHSRIRAVDLTTGIITTYAAINQPNALAVEGGGALLVAHDNQVDRVATDKTVSNFIGNTPAALPSIGDGQPAANARLTPNALAIGPGGEIYVADTANDRIRLINAAGTTSTVAGTTTGFAGDGGPATAAQLDTPMGVAVQGGRLIISDRDNQRIRAVDLATGIITTIAGTGAIGFSGDGDVAATALVNNPAKIIIVGNAIIFADQDNNRIRKIISAIDMDSKLMSFAAKLNFTVDKKTGRMVVSQDSVALKTKLALPAGIDPKNLMITVDIVDLHQQIQLDKDGKMPKPSKKAKTSKVVQEFDFTFPSAPPPPISKFILGLKTISVAGGKPTAFGFISKGTFREKLGRAGFTDVTTPKEGLSLPLRVNITLGMTTFTGLITVNYKATQDKGGVVKSLK